VTRVQLAQCLIAALLGGGITAGLLTATGTGSGAGVREQGLFATSSADEQLTAQEIYDRAAPAVVHISARSLQPGASPFEVDSRPGQGIATGSGFVIDDEGHVLTNAHVVSGATAVRVRFPDLRDVSARIVAKDEQTDLALLAVDIEGLDIDPLELADSDQVRSGDRAVALGNPSGLETIAGTGIVSGPRERIQTAAGYVLDDVIRTDAVIEPGTSGGPLIGPDGRVIGITSRIEDGGDPIGFAVPANTVKDLMTQLEQGGYKLIRPYLGVRGRTIDASQPAPDGDGTTGVLVLAVDPGSPAEAAGLRGQEGGSDVIDSIDGRPVRALDELLAEVDRHEPGDTVELGVLRDGSHSEVPVTLSERPATLPAG
jgi:S1-C subfamily serine protease